MGKEKKGRGYTSSPMSLGTGFLKIHDHSLLYSLCHFTQVKNTKGEKAISNVFLPTEAIVMDMDPFLHCVIPNFIQSQNFLEGLQKELLNLDFHEKYNDLYKFQQVFICLSHSLFHFRTALSTKSFITFRLEALNWVCLARSLP